MGKAELGAHVQKDSATDTNWYIVPLCVKHSIRAESLEVADTTLLVSAHVTETCAKQLPIGFAWPHEFQAKIVSQAQKHGNDPSQVQDWLDHAVSAKARIEAKRKERPRQTPLKTIY